MATTTKATKEPALPLVAGLNERKMRSLGKKLDKLADTDGIKHREALRAATEGPVGALLWHLVRHGLTCVAPRSAGLVNLLSEHVSEALTVTEVIAALRGLPENTGKLDRGHARALPMLTPGILLSVDALIVEAYVRGREALLAARETLGDNLTLAIEAVRRRAGETIDPAAAETIFQHLMVAQCSGEGLATGRDVPRIVDGARVEARLTDAAAVGELARLFGERAAWDAGILAWLRPQLRKFRREPDAQSKRTSGALQLAPLGDVVYLFGDSSWRPESLLAILDRRADSPEELLAAAKILRAEGSAPFRLPDLPPRSKLDAGADDYRIRNLAEVLTVVAIERLRASDAPIPAEADASFDLQMLSKYTLDYALRLRAALAALGPERAHAVTLRLVEHRDAFTRAVAIADVCPDPAVIEQVLTRIDTCDYPSSHPIEPMLLGLSDLSMVEAAAAHADAQEDPQRAHNYREGILHILARASAAGTEWDPALDRHISLADIKFGFGGERVETIVMMLRRLPLPRYRAIMEANISRRSAWDEPAPLVRCLREDAPEALVEAVFAAVVAAAKTVKQSSFGDAIRHFSPQMVAPIRRAIGDTNVPGTFMLALERALDHGAYQALLAAIGRPVESRVDELRRLAAAASGPKTTIYLLSRVDGPPPPSDVGRIGGPPIGIAAAAIPRSGDRPMEHVLTLDLAKMPALARAGARALALFLPDPDRGQDHESGAVVWIPEAALVGAEVTAGTDDGSAIGIEAIDVPSAIFYGSERDEDLRRIRSIVYTSSGYAGGGPLWLQDGPAGPDPSFLLQFDESIASINLGDMGVMYVHDGFITWQCH